MWLRLASVAFYHCPATPGQGGTREAVPAGAGVRGAGHFWSELSFSRRCEMPWENFGGHSAAGAIAHFTNASVHI
jgi:hypothetical protein